MTEQGAVRTWDVREFAKPNLPDVVSRIDPVPFGLRGPEPIRVLDMPIKMPGIDGLRIPESCEQFQTLIIIAMAVYMRPAKS